MWTVAVWVSLISTGTRQVVRACVWVNSLVSSGEGLLSDRYLGEARGVGRKGGGGWQDEGGREGGGDERDFREGELREGGRQLVEEGRKEGRVEGRGRMYVYRGGKEEAFYLPPSSRTKTSSPEIGDTELHQGRR